MALSDCRKWRWRAVAPVALSPHPKTCLMLGSRSRAALCVEMEGPSCPRGVLCLSQPRLLQLALALDMCCLQPGCLHGHISRPWFQAEALRLPWRWGSAHGVTALRGTQGAGEPDPRSLDLAGVWLPQAPTLPHWNCECRQGSDETDGLESTSWRERGRTWRDNEVDSPGVRNGGHSGVCTARGMYTVWEAA